MREKIKLVTITLVLLSLVLAGCGEVAQPEDIAKPLEPAGEQPTQPTAPVTAPPSPVKEGIPSISLAECLIQIKETNPEMTDQQAKDNCYTIEALNTGDKSLCNEVSEEFRSICEQQFE